MENNSNLDEGKKTGFFSRLVSGLSKTRDNIASSLNTVFSGFTSIDEDLYEELEEILIMSDIGMTVTGKLISELRKRVKEDKIKSAEECKLALVDIMVDILKSDITEDNIENPVVLLIVGVNGVGKTTTCGKLASKYSNNGKKVILAAADTYRAAAIEQLTTWSERANCDIVKGVNGSDPGAVVYDAIKATKARGADVLIIDTAGRLHNKKNLMQELKKIRGIVDRELGEGHCHAYVVLDGTTGQNAINQAKEFNDVTKLNGLIITKLDGTAKGGIAIAIQDMLGYPIKYLGIGEGVDDMQEFDADNFVRALFDYE